MADMEIIKSVLRRVREAHDGAINFLPDLTADNRDEWYSMYIKAVTYRLGVADFERLVELYDNLNETPTEETDPFQQFLKEKGWDVNSYGGKVDKDALFNKVYPSFIYWLSNLKGRVGVDYASFDGDKTVQICYYPKSVVDEKNARIRKLEKAIEALDTAVARALGNEAICRGIRNIAKEALDKD